jgi:ferredoxin
MRSKIVDLYYFSGTGNTYLVVQAMAETFSDAGIETHVAPIDMDVPVRVAPDRALGLAFPVAYQSTYPFLWRYFRALPAGQSAEAFMVDTMGGMSGAIVGRLKAVMVRKGYEPIGACEIQMPMNFWLVDPEKMGHSEMIDRGLQRARSYACDLIQGRSHWGRIPLLADLAYGVYLLYRGLIFTRPNQRLFRIRNEPGRCISCGRCARSCPVKNIAIAEDAEGNLRPVFMDRCEFCLKCLAQCPEQANSFIMNRERVYRAPGATNY